MDFQRSDLHPLWASWVGNLQAQNGCQHGELSFYFVHRVSHFFLFVQNFTFVLKYNMDILILHKFWDEFCWFIVYFCLKGTKCEILCTKWKESSPCWQPFCACRLPTQGAHEGCKSDLWKSITFEWIVWFCLNLHNLIIVIFFIHSHHINVLG